MLADITCKRCGVLFRAKTKPSNPRKYCSRACQARISRNKKHGLSRTTEHRLWTGMRLRCNSPYRADYPRYGGRGIRVCERWDDFANFLADMGPRPGSEYTIERVNNDGNYDPSNCKWIPRAEQSKNRIGTYTVEQDQIIRDAVAQGLNFRQMAELLGKPQCSVSTRCYRMGLKSGQRPIPKKGAQRAHGKTGDARS